MAQSKVKNRPHNMPAMITVHTVEMGARISKDYYFDQIAPITGDGIYRRENQSGVVEHALQTNPNARAEQLKRLGR